MSDDETTDPLETEYENERTAHYRKRFNKEAMCDIAARRDGDIRRLERDLAAARAEVLGLEAAVRFALDHLIELQEAWERGVMREGDNLGGTRSNRNTDAVGRLRAALEQI